MPRYGLYIICLLLLIFTLLHTSNGDTRITVYYPLSWTQSRQLFGFPPHFRNFFVPIFSDWVTHSKPNLKSWKYVINGHYEVPLYLKEGFWIPEAFLDVCSPQNRNTDMAYLIRLFTNEDNAKHLKDSIRQHFTYTAQYFDEGYFVILYYLLNMCMCKKEINTELHCPNPCYKPKVCEDDPNSLGICRVVRTKRLVEEIPWKIRFKVEGLYSFDYDCICRSGHTFDIQKKKCLPVPETCNGTKCLNNGQCQTLPEEKRIIPDVHYMCICGPAWEGYTCETPRNPCLYKRAVCGPHECRRDPTNEIAGYSCVCPTGSRARSHRDPKCYNINECIEGFTNPCLNGGKCVDKVPGPTDVEDSGESLFGFDCICENGYSGSLCQIPPPPAIWSTWDSWTSCSVDCGVGHQTRKRVCSIHGRCVGKRSDQTRCMGPFGYCQYSYADVPMKVPISGYEILQAWGIGWNMDEDRQLNDAFFWSEAEAEGRLQFPKDYVFRVWDFLQWSGLNSLSRKWTMEQLLIGHAIIMAFLLLPFALMVFVVVSYVSRYIKTRQESRLERAVRL